MANKKVTMPKAVGVSGNGPSSWGGDFINGEYLKKLAGASGRVVFDEMRRSDPQIKTILSAITLPLRNATYYVEPASDTPADRAIAEETEDDFLRNMTITWDDTIRHILLKMPFGFSILEKVWEYRDDKIRPRKLDPRLPQSITGWKWDYGKRRLIGPIQSDEDGKEIILPIEQMLVFSTEKEGDNWEGISLLRPLYKPWYIKNNLEKINAIKHDRHGVGIPKVTLPPGVSDGDERYNQAVEMLEDLQAQEQSYIIEPDGWVVSVLGAGGVAAGTDVVPSIKYYDEAMARAALTMFVMLGQTNTGSRSLGDSFTDIFLLSLQTEAKYITEVLNRFAIRQYVDYNWNVNGEYPILKVRQINKLDTVTLAALQSSGLITYDTVLENAIREELNLPSKIEEDEPDDDGTGDDDKKDGDGDKKKKDKDKLDPDADDATDNSDYMFMYNYAASREHTPQENLCALYDIEHRLDGETLALTESLIDIRNAQQQRIVDQIIGGKAIQNVTVPDKKAMFDLLIKSFKSEYKISRKEVVDEMQRQLPDKKLAGNVVKSTEIFKIIEEELGLKVEGASNKLLSQVATEALNLKKKGLTGAALKSQLLDVLKAKLTDGTWSKLASTSVNQAWGTGRKAGMEQYADNIKEIYRSAILDGNLCDTCRSKDQVTHEMNDPEFTAPDPECDGGPERCRCINIAIMNTEDAQQ